MSNEPIQVSALSDHETFPSDQVLTVPESNLDLSRPLALSEIPRTMQARVTVSYRQADGGSVGAIDLPDPVPFIDADYRNDMEQGGVVLSLQEFGRGSSSNSWVNIHLHHEWADLADQAARLINKNAPHLMGGHVMEPGESMEEAQQMVAASDSMLGSVARVIAVEDSGLQAALAKAGIDSGSITELTWKMPIRKPSAPAVDSSV